MKTEKEMKVYRKLIRGGFNEADVTIMMSVHYAYAARVYDGSSTGKIADVISTLWYNN